MTEIVLCMFYKPNNEGLPVIYTSHLCRKQRSLLIPKKVPEVCLPTANDQTPGLKLVAGRRSGQARGSARTPMPSHHTLGFGKK